MKKIFIRRLWLVIIAATLVAATPYSAQDISTQGFGNKCTPAGTWWGGSDNLPVHAGFKYLMTIVPSRAGRFSVLFNGAYTMHDIGFPVETQWTGELVKKSGNYKLYLIRLVNADASFPPQQLPLIQAVTADVKFVDCDTISVVFDFFGIYFWDSGSVPFVDPPDAPGPPTPIYETYKRMPTD
jgi:hypothetical protein